MTEDENKTQAPSGQPENTDQGTVDTNAAPRDGEGCESVTVVIIARNEKFVALTAQLVKKNLIGVDADIHLVSGEHLKDTDIETLLEHLPHVQTERIILMKEDMLILNPVTIYEIGVRKALSLGTGKDGKQLFDFNAHMPVLMHKSALEPLLKQLLELLPHADIADSYAREIMPEVRPIVIGDWHTDPWLLPVVTKNPPIEALKEYGQWKKFLYVAEPEWPQTVVEFVKSLLPEEA